MVTVPRGYVGIHTAIPEHLRDAIDSEIVERCGYVKKGLFGEIVREAIEEYLAKREYERGKIISKKNGLAPVVIFPPPQGNKRQSLKPFIDVYNEICTILPYILTEYLQLTSDNRGVFITTCNLEKSIIEKTGVSDKRSIQRKIRQLVSADIISPWDHDIQNKKPMNYSVNIDLIMKEYKQILDSVDIPVLKHYDPIPITSSLKALSYSSFNNKTDNLTKDEIINYILLKESKENNSFNRMSAEHKLLHEYLTKGLIEKVNENTFNISGGATIYNK